MTERLQSWPGVVWDVVLCVYVCVCVCVFVLLYLHLAAGS